MKINKSVSEYLLKLIKATLNNENPNEKPDDVKWDDLLELAEFHKVEQLAYNSIQKLNYKPQNEVGEKWNNVYEKNQIISIMQEAECQQIICELTNHDIDIVPLKGILLKELYPNSSLRQMGDLDFLVDVHRVNDIPEIMEELGYSAHDIGLEDSHDVYVKRPYVEVEIHRRLLPPTEENHWHTDNIWDRVINDRDNKNVFHMTLEDFYLYHLLHFEKHYSMGGSGIKYIADQYVFMRKYENKLDFNYINPILKKMKYTRFEKMCNDLAQAWFGDGEITEEIAGPAEFIINSGVFGTFEQYQKWAIDKFKRESGKSKVGFFFNRMFMERERMEFIYPSIKKHGWLLPFCWIHRLFKAILFSRGRIKAEIKEIKK